MNETYYKTDTVCCFMQHSALLPKRKTLLFLHGIGDSSLSYLPFFQTQALNQFNILVPDLLGHGKSSSSNDYSFQMQSTRIINQIHALQKQVGFNLNDIILIPHSMASIHATLLCDSTLKTQITGLINVEGSLTQYGSFVSEAVVKEAELDHFDSWFHKFKEITIFEKLIKEFPVCRSYYASLQYCHPQAFLQNALELREISLTTPGKLYSGLDLPKIYCYGDKSLCKESIAFLRENNLTTRIFHTNNHFLMLACFDEFAAFVCDWVISL